MDMATEMATATGMDAVMEMVAATEGPRAMPEEPTIEALDEWLHRGRCPSDEVREYCQALLCRLPWAGTTAAEPIRALGVTSCSRGEGVSTVAWQLAATAAFLARGPVLLVDANLTHPAARRVFDLEGSLGLAEVLLDGAEPVSCVQPSPVQNLSILTAGEANGQASWAYTVPNLAQTLETIKTGFDLVVLDMPPAGESGFALQLATLMDGVLFVVEAGRVRWEVAQRTIEDLRRANVRLLGAVLNKRR
jgi:Mrp family chromosome partitioning ATPase